MLRRRRRARTACRRCCPAAVALAGGSSSHRLEVVDGGGLGPAGVERSDDVVEGLAVGVARLDGDGVEVVLVAAAGEPRVAELGVEGVVAEEERDLAGEALGLVDGPGVAVLQVVGDVVERERDVSAVVAADPEAASVGSGDGAEVAVEDAEVVAVLEGEDRGRRRSSAGRRPWPRARRADRLPSRAACARSLRSRTSLRWTAPMTTSRPASRWCHQSRIIWSRSASLLWATVTWPCSSSRWTASCVRPSRSAAVIARSSGSRWRRFSRSSITCDPLAEAREQPASLDRRELLRIADEHDLGVGPVGFLGEGREQAGAEHAGLVDHEDVAFAKPHAPGADGGMERVGRRGGDAGSGFQLPGGSGGERDADDAVARCLERFTRRRRA